MENFISILLLIVVGVIMIIFLFKIDIIENSGWKTLMKSFGVALIIMGYISLLVYLLV